MKDLLKKIKVVFASVREYKKYAIITPFFMMGEAAIETCIPFVMSLLMKEIQGGTITVSNFTGVWVYSGILLGMALASIICGVLGGVFASKASSGLAKNLRHDLYEKVESFSFGNIDHFSQSSLITRMTTDIGNATMAFQMTIRIVVRAPLMLLFSVIMAFVTGKELAWIFIALIPFVTLGFGIICYFALPIFRRVFKRYDKLNQTVQENISGIRVVKSFVREDFEQQKFNQASSSIAKDFIKAEKVVAMNQPLINTSIHVSNILLLSIASAIIIGNAGNTYDPITDSFHYVTISPSDLSACVTYGIQILMNLLMISVVIVMLIMSLESIRRIGEVMEEQTSITNPEDPCYEVKNGNISFSNVNFKYSEKADRNALENINISVKSGQFVGIIGSTGSGKSSLINLISRLYDVSEGEVLVGDKNVKEYDLVTLRDNVSVVLQKNVLFSGTIKSNLLWGNINATDEQIVRACQIAQADEFIQKFPDKYDTKIEQGGTNVSGGQKQRLCIARALLKNPKILILDDSTSAVDTKTDALIRKGLKEDLPHVTKIVVAQRISSIENADLIIVMDNGKINACGTHDELLKHNEIYRDVFFSQTKKGGK